MTQEDKELLFKDLCARLPYEIKMRVIDKTLNADYPDILGIDVLIPRNKYEDYRFESGDWIIYLDDVKPYLRPMSSMTEEEKKELEYSLFNINAPGWVDKTYGCITFAAGNDFIDTEMAEVYVDWLLSHHFDYRGLIEKGLALEAPDGMY